MTTAPKGLDLDAIEATLEAMPRIPRFPAYFHDMRLLIEEVKGLRAENERLQGTVDQCGCMALQRRAKQVAADMATTLAELVAREHEAHRKKGEGEGDENA